MSKMKKKEMLVLILCLLLGFVFRFYTFDQKSLWMDEIYTFNDSRDDFKGQLNFYRENPTYLHPPLFFILTHQFYPFTRPERDLRIIPLIFGTFSILMIYFLSRSFSSTITFPCTLSLTFMAYHISLSQDGRSYALLMFIGMASLYFLVRHLKTLKLRYLFFAGLFFAILFHTSYSSIPFIAFTQLLWFYRFREDDLKPSFSSFIIMMGFTLILCLPWISFILLNYQGKAIMDPFHTEDPGPFWEIMYGIFHDWMPHLPLIATSIVLLILLPFFSKKRRNALILLGVFTLPIGGLYLFCKLLNITHFITSRYFISFLPLFFITIYLSLNTLEFRFDRIRKLVHLKLLFLILFIASNLIILPLYYRSEKQDFRGLVTFLKSQLKEGDKIFVETAGYMPGVLHYFGVHPEGRHYNVKIRKESDKVVDVRKSFKYQNKTFTLYYSKGCCSEYVADGSRLWIIVGKWAAKNIQKTSPSVLKGYFDGSFLNFSRFPTDASLCLFLWDPQSPYEKGIDMPIE
jgi:4-amino-4-deoxy-L-arabinose transferase-like glycosyltransferase